MGSSVQAPVVQNASKHLKYLKTMFPILQLSICYCGLPPGEDLDLMDSSLYLFDFTHLLKQPCWAKNRECLLMKSHLPRLRALL